MQNWLIYCSFLLFPLTLSGSVVTGLDQLFTQPNTHLLASKRIGLITNHTAVTRDLVSSVHLFKEKQKEFGFELKALFSPEHGIDGSIHGSTHIENSVDPDGIPIFSLWGNTWRPTEKMLNEIDLLVYDIQDIGSRSYTYITTLFFAMEEGAKHNVPVVVLDRPNPINGVVIDGPSVRENAWRSRVSYINVPYCHGMTIGELAKFFNAEYQIGCKLTVVPMKGWKRTMSFAETGLHWIPTSPYVPTSETAFFYPMTGIFGEIRLVNTGVGFTLPFKLLGAPFMDAKKLTNTLNEQKLPGVRFTPHFWVPIAGRFKDQLCQGCLLHVTDHNTFLPITTAYTLIGIIKSLYPKEFQEGLENSKDRYEMFCKVNGTDEVLEILQKEKFVTWKLRNLHKEEKQAFTEKRKKYLLYP